MSSCTYLEWHYLAHDDFDMASISGQVDGLVSRLGLPRDAAGNLKELFECGETELALESGSIIEILDQIASFAPKVSFAVRSLGEAPRMIWVREYERGRTRFAFGPPKGAEAAAEAAAERDLALFDGAVCGARAPWKDVPAAADLEASCDRLAEWFRSNFADAPELAALIDPGAGLTLVDVNETYVATSCRAREQIVGKSLFELFPDNPNHPDADCICKLFASLRTVAESGQSHDMGLQSYAKQDAEGVWTPRYWWPVNSPLYDDKGRLTLLLHIVAPATAPASDN